MDFAKFVPSIIRPSLGASDRHQYETIVNTFSEKPPEASSPNSSSSAASSQTKRRTKSAQPPPPPSIPFSAPTLHRAATNGDLSTLQAIAMRSADAVNCTDSFGWSALMMACCAGHRQCVAHLLRRHAATVDLAIRDAQQRCALSLAAAGGHTGIVEMLHAHLRRQNEREEEGEEKKTVIDLCESDDDGEAASSAAEAPFFCADCQRSFADTTRRQHSTTILHRFNIRDQLPALAKRYHLPDSNRGFQLMLKQGWDRERPLGPLAAAEEGPDSDDGGEGGASAARLYPLKTTLRKARSGLGVPQRKARITHFQPHDVGAVERRNDGTTRRTVLPVAVQTRRKVREDWLRNRRREQRLRADLS